MTLDFEEGDVACLPGRHSQIARLLRALAGAQRDRDGRPVDVSWSRRQRRITLPCRRPQGGGTPSSFHDSVLYAARRAGWVEPAADPPNGTWMLTAAGRAVLEALP